VAPRAWHEPPRRAVASLQRQFGEASAADRRQNPRPDLRQGVQRASHVTRALERYTAGGNGHLLGCFCLPVLVVYWR